jgi:hypothetical protein
MKPASSLPGNSSSYHRSELGASSQHDSGAPEGGEHMYSLRSMENGDTVGVEGFSFGPTFSTSGTIHPYQRTYS